MQIFIGTLSLIVVEFLILPYIDSFAYVKKSLLIHAVFGFVLGIVNNIIGLTSPTGNALYVVILIWSRNKALKIMQKEHPDMKDVSGHSVVNNSKIILFISYTLGFVIYKLFV